MMSRIQDYLSLSLSLRRPPADLTVVSILVVLTWIEVAVSDPQLMILRFVLGLPFLLFFPGYVLVVALFPESAPPEDGRTDRSSIKDAPTHLERFTLAFGASIAIVALIGLTFNFTYLGITLWPVLLGVGTFTLVVAGIATLRRWQLPPDSRYTISYLNSTITGLTELFNDESTLQTALNVVLIITIILSTTTVYHAVSTPVDSDPFTEFYLVTQSGDEQYVADGYPTEFTAGEPKTLTIGVQNHEQKKTTYYIVGQLQRIGGVNNTTDVTERQDLTQLRISLSPNESRHIQHEITPQLTGTRLRLQYKLYMGDPPSNLTGERAYRETHLWVNVSNETAERIGR